MKFLGAVIVCLGLMVLLSPLIYWMAHPELTLMEVFWAMGPVGAFGVLIAGAGGTIVRHYEDMEDCE